jgi:regulator of protease activity HflC (stomatin/prohibitin superfamily)
MKKGLILLTAITALMLTSCYDFNREQAEKDAESKGKQTLLEAESSKKAKIEEAKAELESAKLEAETKKLRADANSVARQINAKAEADAINTISKSIADNPEFLKYKQIESLSKGKSVFVATEGNMPILMQSK